MSRDDATLRDILKAAKRAVEFLGKQTKTEFLADSKTQSAVLHQLLILGEAAKRISETVRASHPTVPWKSMTGLRDRLIHAYDAVDLEEVWSTVHRDLPPLITQVEVILAKRRN